MRRRYRRRGQAMGAVIVAALVLLIMLVLILLMRKWKTEKKEETEAPLPMQTIKTEAEECDRTVYVTFPSETFILEGEEKIIPAIHLLITAKSSRIVSIREAYTAYTMSLHALCDIKESLDGGICDADAAREMLLATNGVLRERVDDAFADCLFMGKEDALDDFSDAVQKEIAEVDKLCEGSKRTSSELSKGIHDVILEILGE